MAQQIRQPAHSRCDTLESRTLFIGDGQAALVSGVLELRGTTGNDIIYVSASADTITSNINGSINHFPHASVARFDIQTFGGDDLIDTSRVNLPANVQSGDGQDTVETGDGNSAVYGDVGDDVTHVGVGNCTVTGGDGQDQISGVDIGDTINTDGIDFINGVSDDAPTPTLNNGVLRVNGSAAMDQITLQSRGTNVYATVNGVTTTFADALPLKLIVHALAGDDKIDNRYLRDNSTIYGEDGNDILHAGMGNDRVYGGDGNDQVSGDIGADTLYGDAGNDSLNGGSGNDHLDGGTGRNALRGEYGTDRVTFRVGDSVVNQHDLLIELD